ncbi:limonene-1,2-epoxide hydrolase family protein [Mycobacterium sp. D16R24]|uniref:limonene-1,2-epoxide hydrolase family protein n=1 Tax=Mycobacterium sp. D16R24 TaxID=1855656 RepID=UPI00099271F4|nr:limonene-1,2-epoxide hydrolase family protein [Mycobacterium sp. D16R24]
MISTPDRTSTLAGTQLPQPLSDFFTSWGVSFDELLGSFDLLTDRCQWIQRPIPTLTGPHAARRFLRLAHRILGLTTINVDILRTSVNEHAIFVERIDHLRRADGSTIVSAPVVGIIEFVDGRIIHWREYFDSLEFAGRAIQTGTVRGAGGLVRRVTPPRK